MRLYFDTYFGKIAIPNLEYGGSPACIAMRSIAGRSNGRDMFYYTYVLQSTVNKTLYIGWTIDLDERVKKHSEGKVTSTKRYMKWELIYYEACRSKIQAIAREKQLKTGFGRAYLKRRLMDIA